MYDLDGTILLLILISKKNDKRDIAIATDQCFNDQVLQLFTGSGWWDGGAYGCYHLTNVCYVDARLNFHLFLVETSGNFKNFILSS